MSQLIEFPADRTTTCEGRNGLYQAHAVALMQIGQDVWIEAFHSRGCARGKIVVPFHSDVLRELARQFNDLAERREQQ